jgi:penicillin-binding protein 1A
MGPNRSKIRRLFYGVLGLGVAGFLLLAAFAVYSAFTIPVSRSPAVEAAGGASVYASGAGAPFAVRGVAHGDKISPDSLPTNLANAVVAIEDRRFYSHHGIDLTGIMRAAWHNLRQSDTEGASTITQQLARLTYLSSERTLRRKVQDVMVALWLETRLSKQEILARYLNAVYFGAGAVGADAAAKRYFGKKASDLGVAEAALLAGLIRAPSQLSPSRNFAAARRRGHVVVDAMVEAGMLDKAAADAARKEPVQLAMSPETIPDDNYFADVAEAEVKRLVGSPPADLTITTTFDPRLQDAAQRVVRGWLEDEGARRNVSQAALVAMSPDGAILALLGGRDYSESQFNRATQAKRQPGSLFKIFVYLTALSSGYRPDSMMTDQPVQIDGWEPRNFDGHFRGPVNLRTAFSQSINSVAVQLAQAVGIERVIATAKSLGVQSELRPEPGLALGSSEVTLLEMTRAMDAIATNSKLIEPYTVRAIRSQAGPLYSRPETVSERPEWNWAPMMQLLEAVVTEGTGRPAKLDRRAAGKTGTTDEYRDAWFVGFTSNIVVGVWVGNDDNSPMDQVTGGDIPAKIWHDFVNEAEPILAKTPRQAPPVVGVAAKTGTSAVPPPAAARPAQPAAAISAPRLRGPPQVVDTANLLVNGAPVRLQGIEGEAGDAAEGLTRYIAGREVDCEPAGSGAAEHRCKLGAFDLGEAVLLNGAGRAAANAPERLRKAEQKAREAGRGIWAR